MQIEITAEQVYTRVEFLWKDAQSNPDVWRLIVMYLLGVASCIGNYISPEAHELQSDVQCIIHIAMYHKEHI